MYHYSIALDLLRNYKSISSLHQQEADISASAYDFKIADFLFLHRNKWKRLYQQQKRFSG